ncbi:MAG: sigma-70 family RNA polymerase sigma factor, partial [Saprospiraceae bacterium]|nr:sigma-70 family RNA polymerase sigma factor [Saprospiraceae bacterium]
MKYRISNKENINNGLNDQVDFMKVYHQYAPRVYYYAYSMTKNREDAEEITSDVFVQIWQKRDLIDTQVSLFPLLKKITRDLTWNHLKKISRMRDHHSFIQSYLNHKINNSEDDLIFKEYEEIMNKALDKLTPQQRKVFSLRYFTGKDLNQISEEL